MVAVSRAQPSDLLTILGLRKRLYTESAQAANNGHVSSDQEWRAMHDILGMLLDPFVVVLLAKDGDKPVGMLAVSAGGLVGFYKEQCVTVTWVYIDPAYRDGAVLLSLVRAAQQAIAATGPISVQATIRLDNTAVLDAVTALGYTPIAQIVERKHGQRNIRPADGQAVHGSGSRHAPGSAGVSAHGPKLPARP